MIKKQVDIEDYIYPLTPEMKSSLRHFGKDVWNIIAHKALSENRQIGLDTCGFSVEFQRGWKAIWETLPEADLNVV